MHLLLILAISIVIGWLFHSRRKAYRLLCRDQQELAATLHSIGEAVLATDMAGRVTRLNSTAEKITGWNETEARGKSVAEIFRVINEDTRESALTAVEKVLTSGKRQDLDDHLVLVARDGNERPIAVNASPILDRNGQISGAVFVFRDVTTARTSQRELRKSELRYRTLFESIDEGFCIIEMIFDDQAKPVDYRFIEINPSFERQTGLGHALGKRMRELAPQHETHWFETYGRIAVTGEAIRFQNRAEQLHRTYDVYAFRIGEPNDRQVAILFNDITKSKETEARIVELNADLEARARELLEANKELESFSFSVSHDLRAPLRHVLGYVELLDLEAKDQLSGEARRYLQVITTASLEMGQLIDDLLAFSRMGRVEMREVPIKLDALIQTTISSLETESKDRKIEWNIAPMPLVTGDASMLKQVFTNLIGNAVKYSRQRDPAKIEIGCAGEEDDRIIVFVRDNGAGFNMEFAHKLFGVFQRLHRHDEFEGTGIGLANVRRIVTRHGGRTWAEGKEGEGATFYLTLKPVNGSAKSAQHQLATVGVETNGA